MMKNLTSHVPLLALTALLAGCGADYIGPTDLGTDAAMLDVLPDGLDPDAGEDVARDTYPTDTPIGDIDEMDATDVIQDIPEQDTNPPFLEERQGWAWIVSPDDGTPTQVIYPHLVSPAGKLTGKYADVWNCLREDGGPIEMMSWGGSNYQIQLCNYRQTVVPGEDGTYLHLQAPSPRDGNDPFAEGHSYYSLNKVHDYFRDSFEYTAGDRSLFVAVNMSFQIVESPGWLGLDNAAYLPDASYGFMGFNMHDGEMLAFGQGRRIDFCSDSSVIFHEYTHSVVGRNRLSLNTGDDQGFNADPPAMNEGFADYFASSILDLALLGDYALGEDSRDLAEFKRCPDSYVGESHYDGRIWSSTLWEIRSQLGAEIADQIAYGTLADLGPTTTFEQAAQIMLDVTTELYPEHLSVVNDSLENHNLIACARVLEFGTELGQKGYYLPGTSDSYTYEFQSSVAGTFQHKIVVPEGSNGFIAYFRAEDMYGYDSSPEVKLVVKSGDEQIAWSYYGRPISDADRSFEATRMNTQDVSFSVAGNCVRPGVYYIQLTNRAPYSIIAKLNHVEFPADFAELTWDGCEWPDDPPVVEDTPDVIETDAEWTDATQGDATEPDSTQTDSTQPDVIEADTIGNDTSR
ncbi:MAG TPA: hypothetical protein PLY68_06045 [Myxococcota bacterium]|nr:hypothetical protein [Myxococcota bacterium]HQP95743.1 hypothetical protein [Myxococcota bacterium]